MPETDRLRLLNRLGPRKHGRYVLYWMQQAMRAEGNLALDYAVQLANAAGLPVVACFGLTGAGSPPYPEANARHYTFMLEGLAETARRLERLGVALVVRTGAPDGVALALSEDARLVVCDRGYLKPQRTWRERLAAQASCQVVQVETDVVVPVELASGKREVAARTLRPKLLRLWDEFLVHHPSPQPRRKAAALELRSDIDLSNPARTVASLRIDHDVGPVRRFRGGLSAARERLSRFLAGGFEGYKENRSAPERAAVSHLSPYLHFGQISPVEVALAAREARAGGPDDRASFLDELIVRRELAHNHVFYEPRYDSYEAVPAWARTSLEEHRGDPRPFVYSRAQLEAGETHDQYWNAAMREMRETGYTHNRMRMYWGKKILEWSPEPDTAFATALAINNRYFLDGRDANSFANIGWLFGLHDRPWFRRPIFGLVRYMGENSLRKFDAAAYFRSVDDLVARERR